MQIHYVRPSGHGRDRKRPGDALAKTCDIRNNPVVFPTPERPAASEARLYLVQHKQRLMPRTPPPQGLHVLGGRECRASTLIGFHDYAGDIRRFHAALAELVLETLEGRFPVAPAIGKGNLHEAGIEVHDPFFERRNPAGLLRSERAPVERVLVRHDDVLQLPAVLYAP